MLKRHLTQFIEDFYATSRKALLLTGARQTGKTYAAREFGKKFKHFVEINFIENPQAVSLFQDVSDAEEILMRLSALFPVTLEEGETLIFFDEVQKCDNIITAIKFLVDDGRYRFILSGSLLGVELNDIRSVPVGYMGVKEVYPLTFEEFIINLGVAERIVLMLRERFEQRVPVDEVINKRLLSLFRVYTIVGGMPDVVNTYISTKNLNEVMTVQRDIVTLYRQDISQYARKDRLKIKEIFDLIPSELNEKNKRFILKSLNSHAKFDRYKDEFLWLKDAGVVIPVYNVEAPKEPLLLATNRNLFKLFSNDVGLLTAQYADGIQARILSDDGNINYGAVYENAVAQELVAHEITPFYYNNKKRGEVDFVISIGGEVVPVEVKSGKDYDRHAALSNIMATPEFDIQNAYVMANCNIRTVGRITYIPIYMVMFLQPLRLSNPMYDVDLTGLTD